MITVILVVIVIAGVAAFSVQNATPVAISFLVWRFDASLAVIVLLSFLTGMIVGMAVLSWTRIRRSVKKKNKPEAELP